MRIRTYTRISTDEDHQPYSLEAQDHRLGAYVQSQEDWVLTGRYTDRMSGSTMDRPDLQRALADARLRRYDLLLVYRVDRLARSVRGLSQRSWRISTAPRSSSAAPQSRSTRQRRPDA